MDEYLMLYFFIKEKISIQYHTYFSKIFGIAIAAFEFVYDRLLFYWETITVVTIF